MRGKSEGFEDGLQLLQQARRDLEANATIANGIAAAYTTVQGLNIAFGLATR